MANEKKLDNVILGLLSHEQLTGYEIKKRIDGWLHYFWGASYGSIYPTLGGLAEIGLIEKTGEGSGDNARKKQTYRITESGRERLREWLSAPADHDELRYETLLKLFFGGCAGRDQALEHIRAFREKTQAALAELKAMETSLSGHIDGEEDHIYYLMTMRFGIKSYEAYLEWCGQAEEMLLTQKSV